MSLIWLTMLVSYTPGIKCCFLLPHFYSTCCSEKVHFLFYGKEKHVRTWYNIHIIGSIVLRFPSFQEPLYVLIINSHSMVHGFHMIMFVLSCLNSLFITTIWQLPTRSIIAKSNVLPYMIHITEPTYQCWEAQNEVLPLN